LPFWNFGQPLDGVIQVAFIVDDIQAAMPMFAKQFRVGPWFLIEHFEFDWVKYRGNTATLDISICLGYSGSMMFELIEQHCDTPSVYQETRTQRGFGFHHLAVATTPELYDEVFEDYQHQGAALALEAAVKVGGRAAYLDFGALLPGMIELIEVTPAVEELFSHVKQPSIGWDGLNPVRNL
jgi:Glyoxalase/Bleomycin resistance protein/Dioxygenase superfamily